MFLCASCVKSNLCAKVEDRRKKTSAKFSSLRISLETVLPVSEGARDSFPIVFFCGRLQFVCLGIYRFVRTPRNEKKKTEWDIWPCLAAGGRNLAQEKQRASFAYHKRYKVLFRRFERGGQDRCSRSKTSMAGST